MSGGGYTEQERAAIDVQARIAQTDRDLAESRRARVEAFKLMDEREKLQAEAKALEAQTRKSNIDRWLAPATAIGIAIGVGIGSSAVVAALWKWVSFCLP